MFHLKQLIFTLAICLLEPNKRVKDGISYKNLSIYLISKFFLNVQFILKKKFTLIRIKIFWSSIYFFFLLWLINTM